MARLSALAGLAIACAAGWGQSFSWQHGQQDGAEVPAVRFEYPEQVHVAANHPSDVELHFRVRDGLHINSHVPPEKSLIATNLIVAEPPGVKVQSVDFPAGEQYALKAFPQQKLSVYTGELVLHAHLVAAPGEHLVQAALRYQACDTDSCYPPKQAPVALDVVAR